MLSVKLTCPSLHHCKLLIEEKVTNKFTLIKVLESEDFRISLSFGRRIYIKRIKRKLLVLYLLRPTGVRIV